MQWYIDDSKISEQDLRSLPRNVRSKWELWVNIVYQQGPQALASYPGFHDEKLEGEWKGYRSSRLSRSYRVMYRLKDDVLIVEIIRITKHDYKRRR